MNSLTVLGKYLDQPRLIGKFSRAVPSILVAGGGLYTYQHLKNTPKEEKKKELLKSVIVLAATISSALVAPKAALKITQKLSKAHAHKHIEHVEHACEHLCEHNHHEHEHGIQQSLKEIEKHTTHIVDEFLEENKVSDSVKAILEKTKKNVLSRKEIKTLYQELENNPNAKEFLSGEHGLIPDPENIDSSHIFGEIGRISIIGLFPVLGGILGGIGADKLTEKNWKERIPNKIKEGSYQYLANIFLCNIGAGSALYAMEKAKITTKAPRAIAMISGILFTGLILGSAVANLIGKTCIDPLLSHNHGHKKKNQDKLDLYSERKPEILDVSLHIDDVATVAVMSGLKWIEPALPILYSISGYRAGIGYRNGET